MSEVCRGRGSGVWFTGSLSTVAHPGQLGLAALVLSLSLAALSSLFSLTSFLTVGASLGEDLLRELRLDGEVDDSFSNLTRLDGDVDDVFSALTRLERDISSELRRCLLELESSSSSLIAGGVSVLLVKVMASGD